MKTTKTGLHGYILLCLIRVFSPLLDHSFSIYLLRKVFCETVRKLLELSFP
jgi:hypothetical protein